MAWSVFSVISCLLGMASKEIVATAPLVVLLYDRTFVAGTFREAWAKRRRFYGALAATWVLLGVLMWHNRQRGGTVGFGLGVSPWEYLLLQSHALMLYLKLSVWPHPLVLDYGMGVVRHLGEVWRQGLLIVGLFAATIWALRRRPVPGFVGACFFVILAPSSSLVPLATQTIAEHRMYLPLAAVFVLLVAGLNALGGRRLTVGLCLVGAGLLGWRTAVRGERYRDELAIWSDTLREIPGNLRAQSGVGGAFYNRGNIPEAIRHFETAVRLGPTSGMAQYNLGLALAKAGREEEALTHFAAAVNLLPDLAPAQAELGALQLKLGPKDEALAHLQVAAERAPRNVGTLSRLAEALAANGRTADAVATYERALGLEPESADVHFNFGVLLASLGRGPEAIAQYTAAARLAPRHAEARLNLGILLAQTGQLEEGLAQLRAAASLKPTLAEAHANLGIALAVAGQTEAAVTSYEEALRLRPDYAVAHYNLGNALLQLGRRDEARAHFADAVRLSPGFEAARQMLGRLPATPPGG